MKGFKRVFVLLLLLVVPVTFLAGCNKVKFKISFMVDGEVYDTIKTNGNETISMPENPTKEGYDFDGWYWDEDEWEKPFTANSLLDAPLSSDMKVYARFIVKHTTHTLTHHAFKDATCTDVGNVEYWSCSVCSKLFSDENGTNEITSIEIGIKPHNLTHINKQDATCTANGHEEYWQCQGCDKLYRDANGYFQISSPTIIYSQGHKFGNWTETKSATYTEQGEERRECSNCDHYETRPIPKLVATIVEPTTITIDYGIIKWNGSSPFGFDVIVNGESQTVNTNQLETTLKSNGYNEVKVASINEDNSKSNYVTLNGFVVNSPITNLAYVDDSTNVKFTWESSSNLYDYSFAVNGTEVNIDKATHTYSVKRSTLKKGDVIEVYVKGLASNNVYPSKKVVLSLDQMDSPTLAINKLNVEWNAVTHADKYIVNATSNETITNTTYSYDGANAGEYTITVTALGNNYLCNSSTLTFTKFAKPTISIANGIVSWNDIAGQYMYATLKNGSEKRFEANSFELTDRTQNYEMLLYAYPALNNTMQSDNVLIGNFVYKTYYTAYYGTQVSNTKNYSVAENSTTIYVPTGFETKNFSNCNQDLTLIASQTPSTLSKTLIKNIIVPDDTTTLSASAFSGCSYATTVDLPATLETIGDSTFYNCSSLEGVSVPNSVTTIGSSAFYNCSSLENISVPNNVTSIGNYAFYKCSGLTSITLPFVGNGSDKTNFSYIFGDVPSSLRTVIITGGTSIGGSAFYNCSGLTSITLPNSVTSIGSDAFSGCSGLTSISIPNSITSIGSSAFSGCSGLTGIYISNIESWCNINFDNSSSNPLCYANSLYLNNELVTDLIIPNTVTSIGDSAFRNCLGLTSITIPNSVTSIGWYAFGSCSSLTEITLPFVGNGSDKTYFGYIFGDVPSSLKTVTITSGTTIEDNAFKDCSNLTTLIIPNTIKIIGSSAFSGCSSLTNITIPNDVASIGDSAFRDCSRLTSITIPNSVTSIDRLAFNGCNLESIQVDTGNTVYASPNNCNAIIELATNTLIIGCKNTTIPNTVTSIGEFAFGWCSGLTSITIPNNVTSIGSYAFRDCSGLTSITIPNSVTSIGDAAFMDCSGLTCITIPNSVTSIGSSAFYGCSGLTSIIIPSSITSIGYDAFYNCSGLTQVYYKGTETDWNSINIGPSNSNLTNATRYYYIENEADVPTDGGNYWHYVDNEIVIWQKNED